jgi:hypothetical protein
VLITSYYDLLKEVNILVSSFVNYGQLAYNYQLVRKMDEDIDDGKREVETVNVWNFLTSRIQEINSRCVSIQSVIKMHTHYSYID